MSLRISSTKRNYSQCKTIDEKVEWILENYPNTRDDSGQLLLIYTKKEKLEITAKENVSIKKILRSLGSVNRARRNIQNTQKKYPPSKTVKAARVEKERKNRVKYGSEAS